MFASHKNSARRGLTDIVVAIFFAIALFAGAAHAATGDVWVAVDAPGVDQAYATPGAAKEELTHYVIEPIGYWHLSANADTALMDDVKNALQHRFVAQLEASGLAPATAANKSAATTLVVRLQVVDLLLQPPTEFDPAIAARYRFDMAPGHMTLVAEFANGTGASLLRIADMQDNANVAGWSGVETLLAGWQQQVDTVLAFSGLPSAGTAAAALR